MSQKAPKILVTGPEKGGTFAWWFTALGVRLAGGRPVRMTANQFTGEIKCDGVIIGGGSDIHPLNRTAAPVPELHRSWWTRIKEALLYPMEAITKLTKGDYDKARDEMEIQIIKQTLKHKLPMLAICRGHQLLNSVLGGTMFTSTLPILGDRPRIRSAFPRKTVVYAKEDSLLEDIVGDEPLKVNAIHSQAVATPGEQVEVSAKETKAPLVQAIELSDSENVLGVQWHPEYLFYMKAQRQIFDWLVQEAKHDTTTSH